MYCRNCGKEIDDRAIICPHCGVAQAQHTEIKDTGGIALGLLGFFVPIAGLILFILWKDQRPKTAKAAGIGALVNVILSVLFYVIFFGLYATALIAFH